jgi:hypothetical protein
MLNLLLNLISSRALSKILNYESVCSSIYRDCAIRNDTRNGSSV